jgi:hypothetical protein
MSMITLPSCTGRPTRRHRATPTASFGTETCARLRSELEEDDEELFGDDDELSELDEVDELEVEDDDDELDDDDEFGAEGDA